MDKKSTSQNESQNAQPSALDRRRFLGNFGTVAVAATTAGMVGHSAQGQVADPSLPVSASPVDAQGRRVQARQIRNRAATNQFRVPLPNNRDNGDETKIPNFAASFTKGLPHNRVGEVNRDAYRSLLRAMESGRSEDFDRIPLGGDRKLANPQASFAYSLAGGDSHAFPFPAAPKFSSAWAASEMGEVYLHALLRDVPFDSYRSNGLANFAVREMNKFSDFRGPKQNGRVTAKTLFRGETRGDIVGNYVSQFLLQPIPYGNTVNEQRYTTTAVNDDHMTDASNWLNIQRGGAPLTSSTFDSTPRYINTARDLGEYVHQDFSYQAYLNAALILLGSGTPVNPSNPYLSISNQGAFITFGGAEILTQVAQVALSALKAAWIQKWGIHRRLRPETFSGRVHFNREGRRDYPISDEIMQSAILDRVQDKYGSYFLPMAYPEGSPTHPAYPAGHATIAGACCTVLKAFFDESHVIESPVQVDPRSVATALQPYTGNPLTVGGELNKLANNISLGRDLAGVHWRTDGTEGMLLGEQVAIRMLRDIRLTYNEPSARIQFRGFAGNKITI